MLTPEMNLLINRSDHTYQLIIRLSSNHILNPAVSVECETFEETQLASIQQCFHLLKVAILQVSESTPRISEATLDHLKVHVGCGLSRVVGITDYYCSGDIERLILINHKSNYNCVD